MIRLVPPATLVAAAALVASLAACQGKSPETAQTAQAEASAEAEAAAQASAAAPEAKPGLSLTGGRLVLPAVAGNPGAAYFTLANASPTPATIAAVDVAGAGRAELHETRQVGGHSEMGELADPVVPAGGTLVLARGGKHVMVMDLPAGLEPGATVELTITFAGGDKLSAPLTVQAPGAK